MEGQELTASEGLLMDAINNATVNRYTPNAGDLFILQVHGRLNEAQMDMIRTELQNLKARLAKGNPNWETIDFLIMDNGGTMNVFSAPQSRIITPGG